MHIPKTYTIPTAVSPRTPSEDTAFETQLRLADDLARLGANPLLSEEVTHPRVRDILDASAGYLDSLESGRKARGRADLRKRVNRFVPRFVVDADITEEALIGYPMLAPRRAAAIKATGRCAGVFLLHDEMDYHVLALVPPSETCLYELPLKQLGTHRDIRALGRFTSAWLDKHGPHSVPGRMAGFACRWDLHVFCLDYLYLPMLERNDRR
jgi:hypothetical protein